ncbi:hypothetical protein OE88DRAFT_1739630 [Heliocybe sulcata]|uniref:Uncharacterized protein n=1 Tax=Heliocybe sulcata TaxID=5364 RepID=A0A5C3MQ36_9AGAM|nr:hypothetical protein OE88DRAFT_1739630 [Heliocybe sulcata]
MSQYSSFSRSYDDSDVSMSRPSSSTSSRVDDILSSSSMPGSHRPSEERPRYQLSRQDSFDLPLPSTDLRRYVNRISTGMALNEIYLGRLHEFAEVASELSDPVAAKVAIYQQATQFQTQQLILRDESDTKALQKVLEEVQEILGSKLELTSNQKDEARAVAHRLLIQPDRTDFDIIEELMKELRVNKAKHGFESVFASSTRALACKSELGREASYVRNQLRSSIRDSVVGNKEGKTKACGLTKATERIVKKFVPVNETSQPLPAHMVRMAILRRFVRDHPGSVNVKAVPGTEGSFEYVKTKKGRSSDGDDFWSMVTAFLLEKDAEWGTDLKSAAWSRYIMECIETERRLFPDDPLLEMPVTSSSDNPVSTTAMSVPATMQPAGLLREAIFQDPPSYTGVQSVVAPTGTHQRGTYHAGYSTYNTIGTHDDARVHSLPGRRSPTPAELESTLTHGSTAYMHSVRGYPGDPHDGGYMGGSSHEHEAAEMGRGGSGTGLRSHRRGDFANTR